MKSFTQLTLALVAAFTFSTQTFARDIHEVDQKDNIINDVKFIDTSLGYTKSGEKMIRFTLCESAACKNPGQLGPQEWYSVAKLQGKSMDLRVGALLNGLLAGVTLTGTVIAVATTGGVVLVVGGSTLGYTAAKQMQKAIKRTAKADLLSDDMLADRPVPVKDIDEAVALLSEVLYDL